MNRPFFAWLRKSAGLPALALCLCLGLSGCGSEETFLYYLAQSPANLDPQLVSTPEERTVASALYEGLFRLDENGQPQLAAAESYSLSSDGRTYTIHLKSDLFYYTDAEADPIPITAHDYVFALQRVFMPETQSPYRDQLAAIQGAQAVWEGASPSSLGVHALSDTQLVITLSRSDSYFTTALACPGAAPCNQAFFESTGGRYGLSLDTVLSSGPYYLSGWGDTTGVTLLARDTQGGRVKRLRLPVETNSADAVQRLRQGEADAAALPGDTQVANCTVTTYADTTWVLVCNPARTGLANADVRRALSLIASQQAAAVNPGENALHANGLVPPSVTLGSSAYREQAGSMATLEGDAAALFQQGLAAQGLERLTGLEVLLPDLPSSAMLVDEINQDWQRELFVFFSLRQDTLEEVLRTVAAGDYDIALLPLYTRSEDVQLLLPSYLEALSLSTAVVPEATAPLAGLEGATGDSQRLTYGLALEKALVENAYVTPLFFQNSSFAVANWVKGLHISPFGPVLYLGQLYQ